MQTSVFAEPAYKITIKNGDPNKNMFCKVCTLEGVVAAVWPLDPYCSIEYNGIPPGGTFTVTKERVLGVSDENFKKAMTSVQAYCNAPNLRAYVIEEKVPTESKLVWKYNTNNQTRFERE